VSAKLSASGGTSGSVAGIAKLKTDSSSFVWSGIDAMTGRTPTTRTAADVAV
jgi:hypothetical protein